MLSGLVKPFTLVLGYVSQFQATTTLPMAFLSTKASKAAAGGGGNGGYLSVSKLGDGESYKVAIVSPNPLEFWEVWGEDDAGTKKNRSVSPRSPAQKKSRQSWAISASA